MSARGCENPAVAGAQATWGNGPHETRAGGGDRSFGDQGTQEGVQLDPGSHVEGFQERNHTKDVRFRRGTAPRLGERRQDENAVAGVHGERCKGPGQHGSPERAEPGSVSGAPVSPGKSPDPTGPPRSYLPHGHIKHPSGLLGECVQMCTGKCPTRASYYGDDWLHWLMAETLHFLPCLALRERVGI